jgi:hypothetical protein
MTICILISYVLTSFKEMLWPIKFITGAGSGLKRPAQVTSDSAIIRSGLFSFSYFNLFSAFIALSLVTCAGLFNPEPAPVINFF